MDERYLLQINRIKLQDYVQHGIIAPDKYLGDELERDIQTRNSDFLVMSSGYFEELNEQQLLVELILTQEELAQLHKINDCSFLSVLLPITRIKKIYAYDIDVISYILINLTNSEKGYLQRERFDVFWKDEEILFEKKLYSPLDKNISIDDFSEKLISFDKRMGMVAFMKNTNIYYSDDRDVISNYSEHYFEALSFLISNMLESNGFKQLDILNKNQKFKTLLFSDTQMKKEFIEDIAKDIKDDMKLQETFLQLLTPNGIRKTLSLLLQFGENGLLYYLIGLVYYFRQKDSNKKDNFKIDIKSLIPYENAEISLAILGLYLGYSNIRSEELFELKNKSFKKIFGDKFHMKFRMDSKLDYITIESLFNYSFYNKKGYEFEYLEYPKAPKPSIEAIRNIVHDVEYIRVYYKQGLTDV